MTGYVLRLAVQSGRHSVHLSESIAVVFRRHIDERRHAESCVQSVLLLRRRRRGGG
jgi:hypothetical protein